jgi:5-methylthioadenosine/S-adenosylhomocysteine deaminase
MDNRLNKRFGLFWKGFILLLLLFPGLFRNGGRAVEAEVSLQAVSIYDLQYTTEASGDSPYLGQQVTIRGVVTAVFFDGYVIAEAPGPWRAIYVYTNRNGPEMGDEVQITGTVAEYYGMTEIVDVSDYRILGSGKEVPPVLRQAGAISQEKFEAVLVTVEDVTVTSLETYGEWVVADTSDSVRCDDLNDYLYFPRIGDSLDSVTGVVFYSFDNYKIEPRSTSDIQGSVIPHYALRGHIVTMNDDRRVLPSAYLEILGDRIVAIYSAKPAGLVVINTGGLIFPGLIDAHNHPQYNALDLIPFGETFMDRYKWQRSELYADFKDQFEDIIDYGGNNAQRTNLFKLAEIRALNAGTTTIQGFNANGHSYDSFARQGIGINNAERFPSRILSEVFPLRKGEAYWDNRSEEYWERFVIHLSEGVNTSALAEFSDWQDLVMLDERTVIIHGVPLGMADWEAMAVVGASLIWSPKSNWVLYGTTADVPGALAAGVNVALAPDWTESGSPQLLDELHFADWVDDSTWGDALNARTLIEFVTRNAAQALGIEDWVGQIKPGYQADLVVIPGAMGAPYESMLEASPADVQLVIVNGRPMLGSPKLMVQFPFLDDLEIITVGGVNKKLALVVESHSIPESDKPFSQVLDELQVAYQASDPKVCEFLGLERERVWLYLPVVYLESD